jgi:HEAT repeat protein
LSERLQPVPRAAVKPERIARLIADLDSNDFATRQQATEELQRLAEESLPALEKALGAKPSLEVRQRIESILEKMAELRRQRVCELAALEVLWRIGTPEARKVLEKVATGNPDAPLTREANDILGFLK